MKTKIIVLILVAMICNCKENPKTVKPKNGDSKQQKIALVELPTSIRELAKFAEPSFDEATNIEELMLFKEINENGVVVPIQKQRAVALFTAMTKPRQVANLPIFELKRTDTAILPMQGKGFGGVIWATVMVDKRNLKIKKIAFEHKAESEDYGAAFTQNAFEDQFVGSKINLDENSFILKSNIEKRMDDGAVIDGISGATMTSTSAIEMVNIGLKKYRNYLMPK